MFIGMFKEFIEELAEEKGIDYTFKCFDRGIINIEFRDRVTKDLIVGFTLTMDDLKNEYSACVEIARDLDDHIKHYRNLHDEYCKNDIMLTKMLADALNCHRATVNMFMPHIKDVIFNAPATIVFWSDGTKTVVKCQDVDMYDPEKGLAMAISKKTLGNQRDYYHTFLKWIKKYNKETEEAKAAATFAKFLHHINCSFDE